MEMTFRESEEKQGEYIIRRKTQQDGQIVGWPLCYITVEHPSGLSVTKRINGCGHLRAIRNMIDMIEIGRTVRW